MSEVEAVTQEPEFAAFVGIDWADKKHVWCLRAVGSEKRESGELEHTPEAVEAWVGQLCQRFGNRPIAVAVEQSRGALVFMLSKYEPLHLFPVPSTMSASMRGPNLGAAGGGAGLADLWVQPFTVGWHLKRWDIWVGDAFMIPTGRYAPGASNNVGSGYFGNHLQTGTTYYITKNKGISANLFTDWEVHGQRQGTNNTYKTPGQAFTDEWGVGQVLPLKKDFSQLLQLGVVGYDQWQVTANGGQVPIGTGLNLPASLLPYYSVHAVGGQINCILPAKNFSLFFKDYHEYSASSHTLGNTIVFGGAWTLVIPEPKPAAAPKS